MFRSIGYWAIMYWFGDPAAPYSLKGNAALKFDLMILPPENLWKGFGVPFDPEGLLSTLPAVVNVLAGYLAGVCIQQWGNNWKTIGKLMVTGIVFVLIAEVWDTVFPINKPIWTSSYVLLSIGWDLILIGILIGIIEVASLKKWTYFFEVFGKNPLFIFVMSGIFVMLMNIIWIEGMSMKRWLYENFYLSWLTGHNASILFAITYVLLLWLLGY
jgi:predicted acyltransferase